MFLAYSRPVQKQSILIGLFCIGNVDHMFGVNREGPSSSGGGLVMFHLNCINVSSVLNFVDNLPWENTSDVCVMLSATSCSTTGIFVSSASAPCIFICFFD